MIISSVLPIVGGVATWVNLIADKLDQRGYKIKVINVGGSSYKFTYISSSIKRLIVFMLNYDILFLISYLAARYLLKLRAYYELRSTKYNVIHAQDINACNAISGHCKRNNIKLILTVHGHLYGGGTATRSISKQSWLGRYLLNDEIRAFNQAEHVITVSMYSYEIVSSIINEKKVTLINNFVNTNHYFQFTDQEKSELRDKYNCKKDDFILCYAGQLARHKGLKYVLEGIRLIKNYQIPLKLFIAGEGKEKSELVSLVNMNEMQEVVFFLGEISREELIKVYNLSDIFIMASISDEGAIEGTPMAILEAMACGLPVIATPVGGIPGVVKHMETGILVKEKDEKAIADTIKFLYYNSFHRAEMNENVLTVTRENFSLDVVIDRFFDIYKSY